MHYCRGKLLVVDEWPFTPAADAPLVHTKYTLSNTAIVNAIMAADQAAAHSISFAEATRVEKLDPHTYRVNLDETFCTGSGMNIARFPCLAVEQACRP